MKRNLIWGILLVVMIVAGIAFFGFHAHVKSVALAASVIQVQLQNTGATPTASPLAPVAGPQITHIKPPQNITAFYMTSWIASSPKSRQHVVDLITSTGANALVLDIKDSEGHIAFLVNDPVITQTGSPDNRIRDVVSFIAQLHAKNIYVIGRISTFQDGYLMKVHPDWALTKKSDGTPWQDPKHNEYLDPSNHDVWNYMTALGRDSYNLGFDEINYDYVRYPSDGDIKNINYKLAPSATRADNLESFFKYLSTNIKTPINIPISADFFGQTTTETGDMGIGQVLTQALPYFDYIDPMIYPSHYAHDTYGQHDPSTHPYEIIMVGLAGAKQKIAAIPADPIDPNPTATQAHTYAKIRPWLQDFSIGHVKYTAAMIDLEIKAVHDSGLNSWLMWDPSNRYTTAAYPLVLTKTQ